MGAQRCYPTTSRDLVHGVLGQANLLIGGLRSSVVDFAHVPPSDVHSECELPDPGFPGLEAASDRDDAGGDDDEPGALAIVEELKTSPIAQATSDREHGAIRATIGLKSTIPRRRSGRDALACREGLNEGETRDFEDLEKRCIVLEGVFRWALF
ncbi:hypothetical protein FDECE_4823 [Fusarium decemcellulare]|nr:hypothetical protein FDECE_4823 [Fusarium decemcellulare]